MAEPTPPRPSNTLCQPHPAQHHHRLPGHADDADDAAGNAGTPAGSSSARPSLRGRRQGPLRAQGGWKCPQGWRQGRTQALLAPSGPSEASPNGRPHSPSHDPGLDLDLPQARVGHGGDGSSGTRRAAAAQVRKVRKRRRSSVTAQHSLAHAPQAPARAAQQGAGAGLRAPSCRPSRQRAACCEGARSGLFTSSYAKESANSPSNAVTGAILR